MAGARSSASVAVMYSYPQAAPPARPGRSRRILVLLIVVPLVLVACCGGLGVGLMAYAWVRGSTDTVNDVDFAQKLTVPPLAPSRVDGQGRRVFDLEAREGRQEFFPGVRAETYGINGDYLGPTLRAARGEKVQVNFTNSLDEGTTLHWHGMRLPAKMDGGPHQLVAPGQKWAPEWTIDQPASSLWYHPHPHGDTEDHVYRGLAGMFLIDDPEASALDLPKTYGVDDVPVVVQDKRFDDGRLTGGQELFSSTGRLGDTILVNGVRGPYLDVTSERVRLRLLNGSTARVYNFGLSNGRDFDLIGTDGGLLAAPHRTHSVMLSPGERAEIVVTMRTGERTVLRSYPQDLGTDFFQDRFGGGDDTLDILQLRASSTLRTSAAVPATLVDVPRLAAGDAVRSRRFSLSGTRINGQKMDMGRADAVVERGTTEIWEVLNAGGAPHNFHIHDVQFQVLDIAGERPPPHLRGWKDTVYAVPDRTMRLIATFSDRADPEAGYMFHCHLLRHEDQGMMGQFVVVEPGGAPKLAATTGTGTQDHRHPN